jgi:hypothetical protein
VGNFIPITKGESLEHFIWGFITGMVFMMIGNIAYWISVKIGIDDNEFINK